MAGPEAHTPYELARQMLDAFSSVGVNTYDLTLTTIAGGKNGFRRALTTGQLIRLLRNLLGSAESARHNVIIRPYKASSILVQLDDLKTAQALERVKAVAFLVLNTSPGNYQAWVAVSDPTDTDFARRLQKGGRGRPDRERCHPRGRQHQFQGKIRT
ncbi:MAG TPA: DNA-primase RepB domain-containing protein [Candidatus Binataceae bacterium]|nr:DNA-primase RepB domain-containing protein [Candidatus Binataceae bacterium]